MKMKGDFRVLLVYPNLSMMKVPSLAIALFTTILKKQGYQVDLFDASCYVDPAVKTHDEKRVTALNYRKFDPKLVNWEVKTNMDEDFRDKVKIYSPDVIIVTVVEDTFLRAVRLLSAVKDLNVPNIIGGVFPTVSPEEAIEPDGIKMIGFGEGEDTVVTVCEKIRQGQKFDDVPNIWFKDQDGRVIKNTCTKKLVDLNNVVPDFSLYKEDRFLRPWGGKIFRTITLETIRGCPYDCTFCNSPKYNEIAKGIGYKSFVRFKDIKSFRNEISTVVRETRPELILYIDDTFLTRSEKNYNEWCELFGEFKLPFWVNTRVESITAAKLKKLKEAGCYRLSFSIEHGNEEFRKKLLKKRFTNKEAIEKGKIVAESGIPFSVDYLIGLPFETRELLFDSIEISRQIPNFDAISVNIFTPYRGTELRELALCEGFLDKELFPNCISGTSMLRMPRPYLQSDEIDGIHRTFCLYSHFPKNRWRDIERAEKFDEEGNRIFQELGAEFYKEKFGDKETTFYSEKYKRKFNL